MAERTRRITLVILLAGLGGCASSPLSGVSRKPLMSSSSTREVDLRVMETPRSSSLTTQTAAVNARTDIDYETIRHQLVDDFEAAPLAQGAVEVPATSASDVNQMGHSLDDVLVNLDSLVDASLQMQQSLLRLRIRPARPTPTPAPALAESEPAEPKADSRKPKAES